MGERKERRSTRERKKVNYPESRESNRSRKLLMLSKTKTKDKYDEKIEVKCDSQGRSQEFVQGRINFFSFQGGLRIR